MAKKAVITSLSQVEQKALALCGIVQDEQLARISPQTLFQELQAAAAVFPDDLEFHPELSRLEYICAQVTKGTPSAGASPSAMPEKEKLSETYAAPLFAPTAEPEKHRYSAATGRKLVAHEARQAAALDDKRKKDNPHNFSHAIHCAHPYATWLGAWFTVFLYLTIACLVLSVIGLLIGIEFDGHAALPYAAGMVAIVITYAILTNMALCSTCRIPIFSFRRYPKHRKAHRIPLLGVTIPTALSIIFCLRYRCPSCGTPQKLFGRRKRRHS